MLALSLPVWGLCIMKSESLQVLEQMRRNCNILEADVINDYFVDTLDFIKVLREQIDILERGFTGKESIEQEEEKELIENKRNTKFKDRNFIVSVYKANDFKVSRTLKALQSEGISISDKQLRNILKDCGVYEGRKGE